MKCKNCGAELIESLAKDGVIECEYCFSRFTLPKAETASEALTFLHMGEHDLDTGKFSEAFEAFRRAAETDITEPEAHFGMALSEYGVQTVRDLVNNRLQPVCHKVSEKKFTENSHFRNALRLATPSQKAEYEKRGEEIDYINGEFRAIEESGASYDCFLCVKVTGENGEKTEDSKDADYIYRLLQEKGYKPFYSEREIRNRVGKDYEAMILYALHSAETMLVVCRDEGYLQTPWVKNEYTRFISLMGEGEKESDAVALVYYKDPIERLPGKAGKLQGIDFSLREADGQILSFVEAHTPEAKRKREEAEKNKSKEQEAILQQIEESKRAQRELEEKLKNINAQQQPNAVNPTESLYKRAMQELESGEYKKAQEYFERVLDGDPENGRAWQGLYLANCHHKSIEELFDGGFSYDVLQAMLFDNALARAQKYADGEDKERLEALYASLKERYEAAQKKKEYEDWVQKNFEISGEYNRVEEYKGSDEKVTIPDGVTYIDDRAFLACFKLREVTIPDSVRGIGKSAFQDCIDLRIVHFGAGLKKIEEDAFRHCRKIEEISLPQGLEEIGYGAFTDCKQLKSVTLPRTLKTISGNAFWGCEALKEIVIPDSVTAIGNGAFGFCKSLKKIVLPEALTEISLFMFNDSAIAEITVPQRVTKIAQKAFHDCTSLKRVVLPAGLTEIEYEAFLGCAFLQEVVFNGSKKEFKKIRIGINNKPFQKAKKIFMK